MGYHIYTTEGIVLKRVAFGEANILLHILTSDLGLIIGSAKSARLSVSKLRPALQEYSYVLVSCIKGKNGWKITNVAEKSNFFFGYPTYSHKVLTQVSNTVLKMITGESPHREIFEILKSGFVFLKEVDEKKIHNFEILIVLRILFELGYVDKNESTDKFLDNTLFWDDEVLDNVGEEKVALVSVINKALRESQL